MRTSFAVVLSIIAQLANAQGFPTTQQLVYRGAVVAGSLGASAQMRVTLWKSASGTQTSDQHCGANVLNQTVAIDTGGRFEVPLHDSCIEAVRVSGDVWYQLEINNTPLPRSLMKAVPFALKAQSANRQIFAGPTKRTSDGVYCNRSMPTAGAIGPTAGGYTGYRGAKVICEATCQSPTAHMCTLTEIIRSHELEIPIEEDGWVKNGVYAAVVGSYRMDCNGFQWGSNVHNGETVMGYRWDGNNKSITLSGCASSLPILCCD